MGHLDMAEAHVVAQRVAAELDAVVLSVDYHLAPAHVFPVPQDDVVAVVETALGDPAIDPTRVALGGASAGGHMAACAAHRLVEAGAPLAALFLAYPATDPAGPYPLERPPVCPELIWFDLGAIGALFANHVGGSSPPAGSVPMELDPHGCRRP